MVPSCWKCPVLIRHSCFCFNSRCLLMTAPHWEWLVARVWPITPSALASVHMVRWSLRTTTTTSTWRCSVQVGSWWERWKALWSTISVTTLRSPMTAQSSLPAKTTTCSSTSILFAGCHQMLPCHCWSTTFKPDLPRLCQHLASVDGIGLPAFEISYATTWRQLTNVSLIEDDLSMWKICFDISHIDALIRKNH